MAALAPLFRLSTIALALFVAWRFGLDIGHWLLLPHLGDADRERLLYWIAGGMAVALPIVWIGNAVIGNALERQGSSGPLTFDGAIGTLWTLAFLALAVLAGWSWGPAVGERYAAPFLNPLTGGIPALDAVAGGLLVGIPVFTLGKVIAAAFSRDAEGSTSGIHRRIVGWLWRIVASVLALIVVMAAFSLLVWAGIRAGYVRELRAIAYFQNEYWWIYLAAIAVVLFIAWTWLEKQVKTRLGRWTATLRRAWHMRKAGQGGSARFAGLFDEWAHPADVKGAILLGRSLYEPAWNVGLKDDRAALTIAANRSGKGRSTIIPNLLTWPHSALVIDPKGTNAAVTAAKRGMGGGRVREDRAMKQLVYVINPFRVNEGLPGMPSPSRFNPLSIVDPAAATVYEDVDLLADALVVPSGGPDSFWDNSARTLIRTVIAHAVTTEDGATLNTVREMLSAVGVTKDGPTALLQAMTENGAAGGMIRAGARQFANAEPRVFSNVVTTAMEHVSWLDAVAMQETLSESDFSIFDLKERPTTIYLVLPPEYLDAHPRFLRLFVNLAIKAASMGGRSPIPILFLLDEFYSLGKMTSLSKAAGNLASYNVKLWPILQNLSQLVELYPDNWEGFIASTGHFQIFGANDTLTARYASERLGRAVAFGDSRDPATGKYIRLPVGMVDLRDHVEVGKEVSRASGRQIVFREGDAPFILGRINYDQGFSRRDYNPDPDVKGS